MTKILDANGGHGGDNDDEMMMMSAAGPLRRGGCCLFFLTFRLSKALVLDTCMGVVTAAMLERMGCQGRIIALYAQTHPSMDAVRRDQRFVRSPR